MTPDFVRGLSAGLLLAVLVLTLGWYLLEKQKGRKWRPISERLVDALCWLAHIAAAVAHAADATLCEYRVQTTKHTTQYARGVE